jgi:hypothetical protein
MHTNSRITVQSSLNLHREKGRAAAQMRDESIRAVHEHGKCAIPLGGDHWKTGLGQVEKRVAAAAASG